MIDWPKVVQDLEKENARLKKALTEQEQDLREFGVAVAKAIAADEDFKMTFEQIVDEVMEKNT